MPVIVFLTNILRAICMPAAFIIIRRAQTRRRQLCQVEAVSNLVSKCLPHWYQVFECIRFYDLAPKSMQDIGSRSPYAILRPCTKENAKHWSQVSRCSLLSCIKVRAKLTLHGYSDLLHDRTCTAIALNIWLVFSCNRQPRESVTQHLNLTCHKVFSQLSL